MTSLAVQIVRVRERAETSARARVRSGYRPIVEFANASLEPIEFEVEEMTITLGKYTHDSDSKFLSSGGMIFPGRDFVFRSHLIYARHATNPPTGYGEYRIRYRQPSSDKWFVTRHRFDISWQIDESGWRALFTTVGVVTHESLSHGAGTGR